MATAPRTEAPTSDAADESDPNADDGTDDGDPSADGGTDDGGSADGQDERSTGPLKVGILYADSQGGTAALGASTSNSLEPGPAAKALVAAFNDRGGLAGRRLEPTYYSFDAQATSYDVQASAACAHFTQDSPVPVVLDYAFGIHNGMAACLAESGVADLAYRTSDDQATNAAALFASGTAMTSDRRYHAVLTGLHGTGHVTAHHKIGVLLEDCPDLQRAYQQTVLPTIESLGLQHADTQTVECTTGFASAGPAAQRVQAAVLRFRSVDVDQVLIVSDYEQVMLLMLANNAESQGWRPGYLLSDQSFASFMRPNIPEGQWPGLHGVGWRPGFNIDDPTTTREVDERCVSLITDGGAAVNNWQDEAFATITCNAFFLLEQALQVNGGNESGSALVAAIESLGTAFDAPGTIDGRTRFGAGRHDGPDSAAPFAYAEDCSCLRYTRAPERVP